MLSFLGIAVSALFCSIILKDKNKSFALALSLAGSILLLFTVFSELKELVSSILNISSAVPSISAYIKLMLKVLAITLLSGFVCDLCRDSGEGALASVTELAAKVVIISLVLPLFESVISIVGGLIK